MATSHIRSITGNIIKFIKTKLSFFANKIRLLFSKPQVATSTSTTHVGELNESQDEQTVLNVSNLSFQVIMDDKIVKSIELGGADWHSHKQ